MTDTIAGVPVTGDPSLTLEKVQLSIRMQRLLHLQHHIHNHLRSDDMSTPGFARYEAVRDAVVAMRSELAPRWWPREERLQRLLDAIDVAWRRNYGMIPADWEKCDLLDARFRAAEDQLVDSYFA